MAHATLAAAGVQWLEGFGTMFDRFGDENC